MTNRNLILGAAAAGLVLVGAIAAILITNRETPEKIDLSSIHTTVTETMAPAALDSTEAVSLTAPEAPTEAANASIRYQLETYTADSISIQYPQILGMQDEEKQARLNELLKKNALSIQDAWNAAESKCAIAVTCEVPSLNRSRISAVYTGTAKAPDAAYPTSLYYTNTVDLSAEKDLSLSDFADPYTMAGYLLSDDVQFSGLDSSRKAEVLKARAQGTLEGYTAMFTNADFPLTNAGVWPESFSYEKQGVIYFSIPVAHALGDYAIVCFTPETK